MLLNYTSFEDTTSVKLKGVFSDVNDGRASRRRCQIPGDNDAGGISPRCLFSGNQKYQMAPLFGSFT